MYIAANGVNVVFVTHAQAEDEKATATIDALKRENEMLKENLANLENLKLARNDAYAEIEVQVEERGGRCEPNASHVTWPRGCQPDISCSILYFCLVLS